MMGLAGILSVWRDWFGVAILIIIGFFVLPATAPVQSMREKYNTAQCRDQMEMILRAEQKHYLDHQSYTTVQRDLNRYEAFAPHARCPLCNETYHIEITAGEIWIQCPCLPGIHGWKHEVAPILPDSTSPKDSPFEE